MSQEEKLRQLAFWVGGRMARDRAFPATMEEMYEDIREYFRIRRWVIAIVNNVEDPVVELPDE